MEEATPTSTRIRELAEQDGAIDDMDDAPVGARLQAALRVLARPM